MFKNYLIIALRNILRQKGYSIINIMGLAIGMACSILILLWVQNELSYDKFNNKYDSLYRLVQTQYYKTGPLTTTCMPGPIARDIKAEIPEIVNSFMFNDIRATVNFEDKVFTEYVRMADPEMLEMLTFEFIRGDGNDALRKPDAIIITDEMSEKYFGNINPIGKLLSINNEFNFEVTGVIKKIPQNSSFVFDFCIPFENATNFGYNIDRYGNNSHFVYVELLPNVDYIQVNEKIKNFIIKHHPSNNSDASIDLFLFPFSKIHLYSAEGRQGDIRYIYIFSAIAIFILIIAGINFMNLSTAQSSKRSLEIGLRKTVGANKNQLIQQFIGESIIITCISFIFSLGIVYFVLPYFNQLSGKELGFNLLSFKFLGGLILLIAFVGLFSGSYPALYLSSFKPVQSLRRIAAKGKGGYNFRRILVIFQFSISAILIICTIMTFKQLDYVQNEKLGMNKENVLFLVLRGNSREKYETIKDELRKNQSIINITRSSSLPYRIGSNSGGFNWEENKNEDDVLIGFEFTDFNYANTLGMNIIDGRYFSDEFASDSNAVVINEKALKLMDIENPVDKWLSWSDQPRFHIVGVVEDFHHLPMHRNIDPLILFYAPDYCRIMYCKVEGKNIKKTIAQIEETWKSILPDFPFSYTFLDDRYDQMYRNEARLSKIIMLFSLIAIFISCLGLFGLISFIVQQKTKEIGIRKILGSSVWEIVLLLSKTYIGWILVANAIAFPIAWFAMKQWLDNYAYHTSFNVWVFVIALLISFLIALLTVSIQSVKAANRNPVNALRYE